MIVVLIKSELKRIYEVHKKCESGLGFFLDARRISLGMA